MKRNFWAILAVGSTIVGSGVLTGCGLGDKPAAIVNGQVITLKDMENRMNRLNPSYRAALGNDRKRLLEEMVMETLLVQEARRRGLERDPEVGKLFKEARRQILLGRLLERARAEQPADVTDEEVAKVYEQNKKNFVEPESFRASHVLLETEEGAKKALERLNAGEPFAKVAEEMTIDPAGKSKGGDIGNFTKGQLIPEFENACEKLKLGERSGIVKSSLGYHVILLTERKTSRQRSLEEVKEVIRRQLAVQKQQKELDTWIQGLRAKAQIRYTNNPPASSGTTSP
ncbi:MAG: peptidyl-prolyl cis-trans isomerase [Candidatus Omnitrophica bacterium]|nr:peptidyl-prolyl cis-trans isomerase [Candidatus Omnitrophota bacterium]